FADATPLTATSPLSLRDALPICSAATRPPAARSAARPSRRCAASCCAGWRRPRASSPARLLPPRPAGCYLQAEPGRSPHPGTHRSEEHTSELQSRENLVCRLLLE